MSTTPITVTVRYSNQAYHCRLQGIAASSTSNPQYAAQRLADKMFGEGTHRARMVRDCTTAGPGEWAIEPVTEPDATHAASIRITLADDGHYYLDVRRKTGLAFRVDYSDLDAALGRARAFLALEPAA